MAILTVVVGILAAILAAACITGLYLALVTRRIAADAERRVPPIGKFINVDGNRIRYVEQGEGRPILFIHGLGAQLHQFRQPLFDIFGEGYRLIAIDRPGSGYSMRKAGASGTLAEQADVVRGFIEALKIERPLLVGHSLGGAVSLATAILHPDAVAGLALLSPHTHHTGTIPPAFAPLYIPSRFRRWLVSRTIAVPTARKYAAQTLAYVFGPQEPPPDYMTAGGGYLGLRPSHIHASSTDIVGLHRSAASIEARYGEIGMPVGILFGTADRLLDAALHGTPMAEKIPQLYLELADGVGHMPQYAEPRRVVAFIRGMAARAFDTNVTGQRRGEGLGGRPRTG